MSPTTRSFNDFSQKSFSVIIEWLKKAAIDNPDKIFIYRPHPGEKDNPVLKALESTYSNIISINALSVKQWIIVSDKIYTWYSTSISEAFYAGKNCQILRPIPINPDQEVSFMEDAIMIKRYEDFSKSLVENNSSFPITEEAMTYAYGDMSTYAYENIADLCEKILKDEKEWYDFKYNQNKESLFKHLFWKTFVFFCKRIKIPWIPRLKNNYYYSRYRSYNREMYNLKKTIKLYEKKLTPILRSVIN
jgi:hypothetical protein